jgi:hypothetical protein
VKVTDFEAAGKPDTGEIHCFCRKGRMMMRLITRLCSTLALVLGLGTSAVADPFFFTTGNPDGRIGMASRPDSADGSKTEIEAGDDFLLGQQTLLYGAIFTGLIPVDTALTDIGTVRVQIYRVFPNDSDTTRTPNVPTRTNSPGDVELPADAAMQSGDRSNVDGNLTFTFVVRQLNYQLDNSVINGIYPLPNQTTGGEGPVTGWLAQFIVLFTDEFVLPADQYFIVPQIELLNGKGEFLWVSAPRDPPPFSGDLQTWIRNSDLDPDWLRVGTDIVGGTTFNASFSLFGETFPDQ